MSGHDNAEYNCEDAIDGDVHLWILMDSRGVSSMELASVVYSCGD